MYSSVGNNQFMRQNDFDIYGMLNPPQMNTFSSDIEGAKAVARRMFELYDIDRNGLLDQNETGSMIIDAYKSFNRSFRPSKGDAESYLKILDRDRDGQVTYQDIEELCMKYLCPELVSAENSDQKVQSAQSSSKKHVSIEEKSQKFRPIQTFQTFQNNNFDQDFQLRK